MKHFRRFVLVLFGIIAGVCLVFYGFPASQSISHPPSANSLATNNDSSSVAAKKIEAQQFANWKNNHIPKLNRDLTVMNATEVKAKTSADFGAVTSACTSLRNDVYAAQQSLQLEMPSISNVPMKAALSSYMTDASECLSYSQHLEMRFYNQQTTTTIQHVYDPCAAGYLYDPPSNTCYSPDQQLQQEQSQSALTNRLLREAQWFNSFSANAGNSIDPNQHLSVPTP